MLKVKSVYQNFGLGSPGWNQTIEVMNNIGEEVGYLSYPMVNCPTRRGIFYDVKTSIGDEFPSNGEVEMSEKELKILCEKHRKY